MVILAVCVDADGVGAIRVQGSGFRVQGSGFRVQGSGFGVQGSEFRGSGFRAHTPPKLSIAISRLGLPEC